MNIELVFVLAYALTLLACVVYTVARGERARKRRDARITRRRSDLLCSCALCLGGCR